MSSWRLLRRSFSGVTSKTGGGVGGGIDTEVDKANPVIDTEANKNKRPREETPEQEDPLFAPEFSPQRTAGERKRQQQKTAGEAFAERLAKEKTAEEGRYTDLTDLTGGIFCLTC